MRALELVEAVKSVGGVLSLSGNRVRCRIPEHAVALIDLLRAQRQEVVEVLRQRARALAHWIGKYCVDCTAASTNPKIAYREYRVWASGDAFTYEEFLQVLETKGWRLDRVGMIAGLRLAADSMAIVEHQEQQEPNLM